MKRLIDVFNIIILVLWLVLGSIMYASVNPGIVPWKIILCGLNANTIFFIMRYFFIDDVRYYVSNILFWLNGIIFLLGAYFVLNCILQKTPGYWRYFVIFLIAQYVLSLLRRMAFTKKEKLNSNVFFLINGLVTLFWAVLSELCFAYDILNGWIVLLIGLLVNLFFYFITFMIFPDECRRGIPLSHARIDRMDGLDFEHYCANQLRRSRKYKSVETTPPTGDFGADITAVDKEGELWVFQCKRYSKKLGNNAIQEIVAAKAHYEADHAAVITNSEFTDNARLLADENDVLLIENELFDRFIKF